MVSPLQGTVNLDGYCARRFTYFTQEQWKKEILSGKVSLNGKVVRNPAADLKGGDILAYDENGIVEPSVDEGIHLLYEAEKTRPRFSPLSSRGSPPRSRSS